MGLKERHAKAIAKLRHTLKDIPCIDYASEKVLPPLSIAALIETLGGLEYMLTYRSPQAKIKIKHIGSQQFDVTVLVVRDGVQFRLFEERVYFASLRGAVKSFVDRASRY